MSGTPNASQDHFRFRSDTGTVDNASPTWLAAEDTNITMAATSVPFRLRIVVSNNSGATANFTVGRLAWSKNGGSYSTMSATTGVTFNSSASSDADATAVTTANFRLTAGAGAAGARKLGSYDENGAIVVSLTSTIEYTEVEFGLSLFTADFVDGDTLDFRVVGSGTGVPLQTYNVTPRITIGSGVTTILGQHIL